MTTTKADLEKVVGFINENLPPKRQIELDGAYGGYKIVTNGGSKELSQGYMPKSFVMNFLRGMQEGMSLLQRAADEIADDILEGKM